jgi:hypothetical protein
MMVMPKVAEQAAWNKVTARQQIEPGDNFAFRLFNHQDMECHPCSLPINYFVHSKAEHQSSIMTD